jgi:hypothetical protein
MLDSYYRTRLQNMENRGTGFWFLHGPGWLLLLYLIYAQAIPAFDYDLGVSMGTQEPAEQVTEVGVAFWYGFAFGDLVIYIPLLALGLTGHWLGRAWGRVALVAALGITVYWPAVCLAVIVAARNAPGWSLPNETSFWIVLPLIMIWAAWALRLMYLELKSSAEGERRKVPSQ